MLASSGRFPLIQNRLSPFPQPQHFSSGFGNAENPWLEQPDNGQRNSGYVFLFFSPSPKSLSFGEVAPGVEEICALAAQTPPAHRESNGTR